MIICICKSSFIHRTNLSLDMCLLCCASATYAGYKTNKALDAAFVKDEPVESYWRTELRHSLNVRGASNTARQQDRETYESYGASRKMSKKEQESRARLQALVDAHAPKKKK